MPRYTTHPDIGVTRVRPVGRLRRWTKLGWHQVGSRVGIEVELTKKMGVPWPAQATLILQRRGERDGRTVDFTIPPDSPSAELANLLPNAPFEVTADGHYTISIQLGDARVREIVSFNALGTGGIVAIWVGIVVVVVAALLAFVFR